MLFDAAYLLLLTVLSPWLVWRAVHTGRYRRDLRAKLTGRVNVPTFPATTVWFHGVSVGEIHLLATLIDAYRKRHPHHRIVVSSTTDTGLAEARKRFDLVIPWPFDFSWAVRGALTAIKPDLVVLAESEMWPNFLRIAERKNIPVTVVNARLSPRSFRRYQWIGSLARRLFFNRVRLIAVQGADYAERFRALGVPPEKIRVTGSIKFDGAANARDRESINKFSRDAKRSAIWVAGSTHAPEERIVLQTFQQLKIHFPDLRLILVPRHPDRFQEVATLLDMMGIVHARRSRGGTHDMAPVLLLDTVGELAAAWRLADVGYVGGSLDGKRGGQSMIEPAGLSVPTIFGPHVWNFAEAARRLVELGGAIQIAGPEELTDAVARLLQDTDLRRQMGQNARQFVAAQQGATARTIEILEEILHSAARRRAA